MHYLIQDNYCLGKEYLNEIILKCCSYSPLQEVVIENGTIGYENWVLPGSPIYREFWVFDVQNPEDVMQNGSAPIVKQKGWTNTCLRW
uniref:Uncharacterized protein n=1 Tax=Laticauda laticaudata TaxID=8630 RepID=A0A8C5RGK6_LATLA